MAERQCYCVMNVTNVRLAILALAKLSVYRKHYDEKERKIEELESQTDRTKKWTGRSGRRSGLLSLVHLCFALMCFVMHYQLYEVLALAQWKHQLWFCRLTSGCLNLCRLVSWASWYEDTRNLCVPRECVLRVPFLCPCPLCAVLFHINLRTSTFTSLFYFDILVNLWDAVRCFYFRQKYTEFLCRHERNICGHVPSMSGACLLSTCACFGHVCGHCLSDQCDRHTRKRQTLDGVCSGDCLLYDILKWVNAMFIIFFSEKSTLLLVHSVCTCHCR